MGATKTFQKKSARGDTQQISHFRAVPVNLLLWGCKTWATREKLMQKLEVLLHQSCRQILRISMARVKEERVTNEGKSIREVFHNMLGVSNTIAARQMLFIRKVGHGSIKQPPKMKLTAWCDNKRKVGGPHKHNKDYLIKNLGESFCKSSRSNH